MNNNLKAKAYTEVLEILQYLEEEELEKIPLKTIQYFIDNRDTNYTFQINPQKNLFEQNISNYANAIFIALYKEYFANEIEIKKIDAILNQNQIVKEEEKRKKYDCDNLFKNREEVSKVIEENIKREVTLVKHKESFFTKFKNFILKKLHFSNF